MLVKYHIYFYHLFMKFALQVMGNQPEGKKDISKEYLKGETGTDDPKGDTYPHNPNFFKDKCW